MLDQITAIETVKISLNAKKTVYALSVKLYALYTLLRLNGSFHILIHTIIQRHTIKPKTSIGLAGFCHVKSENLNFCLHPNSRGTILYFYGISIPIHT
jgi:hypothetical protein